PTPPTTWWPPTTSVPWRYWVSAWAAPTPSRLRPPAASSGPSPSTACCGHRRTGPVAASATPSGWWPTPPAPHWRSSTSSTPPSRPTISTGSARPGPAGPTTRSSSTGAPTTPSPTIPTGPYTVPTTPPTPGTEPWLSC